jgi:hypothetical protein
LKTELGIKLMQQNFCAEHESWAGTEIKQALTRPGFSEEIKIKIKYQN